MNLMQLKYAVVISQTGSINKAAEALFMGQPNLSRAIKELETNLGFQIFERTPRGMVPTPDGEDFLRYANKILLQVSEMESYYQGARVQRQRFSITVPRVSYISNAFVNFSNTLDRNTPYEIVYQESNASRAIRNILESDYRLGVIRYAVEYDRFFQDMLAQNGLIGEVMLEFVYELIMSRNHPLAAKPEIHYTDLTAYTEIAHADPYVPTLPMAVVKKTELPDGIDKRIFVFERCSQFELLSENPDTFMWVSSIPQKMLDRFQLVQRRCADNARVYRDLLIYKDGYRLTELDRAFVSKLMLETQTISAGQRPDAEMK